MFGDNFTPRARGLFIASEDRVINPSRNLVSSEDYVGAETEFIDPEDSRAGDISCFEGVNGHLYGEDSLIKGNGRPDCGDPSFDADDPRKPVSKLGYSRLMTDELRRPHHTREVRDINRATRYSL